MALKDLVKQAPTPPAERPPGITCEKYVRSEGKRCVHYLAGGSCSLPDEFMCVEWLKANGPKPRQPQPPLLISEPESSPEPQPRDLFGNPVPAVELPARVSKPKPAAAPPPLVNSAMEPTSSVIDVEQLRGFTTEDIASFKALGVEVQLHSESYGEFWLVPDYTGQSRKEITPEHAATLLGVLSVFPGSRVVAFEKKANPPNPERPERPSRRS